jgi:hypothetical protein
MVTQCLSALLRVRDVRSSALADGSIHQSKQRLRPSMGAPAHSRVGGNGQQSFLKGPVQYQDKVFNSNNINNLPQLAYSMHCMGRDAGFIRRRLKANPAKAGDAKLPVYWHEGL